MSAESSQATVQRPPTATGTTRVIVIRHRNRRGVLVFLALLLAIIGGIFLAVGLSLDCYNDYCGYRRPSYIICGTCFLVTAVSFLVIAVVHHNKIGTTTVRLNPSSPAQQPVIVSPGYPGPPVIAVTTVPTRYPPPYHPQTEPFPYPLSPADNQYPPSAGFTANPQPTESYPQEDTKPPQYSP